VSDDPSPWPESERTQRLLFAAGALLLLPVVVGLADLADVGGAIVVLCATLASALLVYGLLGWAGTWVEQDRTGDAPAPETEGTAGDDEEEPGEGVESGEDEETGDAEAGTDADAEAGTDADAETDAEAGTDAEVGDAEADAETGAGSDTGSEAQDAAGDQSGPDA
jgi:cytoskeletal protein RodZ